MQFSILKDIKNLDKWDDFVINNSCGNHLQLSNWLETYQSYGFDNEIIAEESNDKFTIGYGAVIAKFSKFKFYIIPCGPIVSKGNELKMNTLLEFAKKRAVQLKCCYMQVTIPYNSSIENNTHIILNKFQSDVLEKSSLGNLFKYVYSSNGLNWIDLSHGDIETFLKGLSTKARRNLRNSERKELICKEVKINGDVKKIYDLFQENAQSGNYVIRDWSSFGSSLQKMIDQNKAIILSAYKNNDLKGAILLIKSGNYFSYIMGGTKKEVPDVRAGQFLQLQAVKLSISYKFDGYNLSLGGSKGVLEFKNELNPQRLSFENSKYHWVLSPTYFKFYLFVEKYMKPYKNNISKILTFLKKKR